MIKFLVILLLLVLAFGFVYWLIHPYIKMAQKALGVIRQVRTGTFTSTIPGSPEREKVGTAQKLVQCARCGTWVPASRAMSGRGDRRYCSHSCMEQGSVS